MKRSKFLKLFFISSISSSVILDSCKKYLDHAPEHDIDEKDIFKDFLTFQGFVEELYNCVFDKNKGMAWNQYLFADETLNNYEYNFDKGNYWGDENYFYGKPVTPNDHESRTKRVWEYAWYGIRKANVALEKINQEDLFQGTQGESDVIKGQAYFFRAFFYFQICKFWGGMPYVKEALGPNDNLFSSKFKRLNFQETAKLMADDFRQAADLLPINWDEIDPGHATKGNNHQRINKFYALGYLGKSLLFAGSPMMNEEANGNNSFNPELCQKAANAFGELLTIIDQTNLYQLESWDSWNDIFYKYNYERPGGTEVIMEPTIFNKTRCRWSTIAATVPSSLGLNSGKFADVPTHNNTKNYRMANGLPIDDPNSGYDSQNPWIDREPRFYKDIVIDGDEIFDCNCKDQYAQLYNGGYHRSQIDPPSKTGYYARKFCPLDKDFSAKKANKIQTYVPYLRMADVYLMYAESVLFSKNGGTPQSSAENYSMTAEEAVNKIRNRGQLPDLDSNYTANIDLFFEEGILRERAVELNFEGARFLDLRRWNLNGDPRFLEKTAIDFDRDTNGKPINVKERVVITRVATKTHNWLPIQPDFVKLYKGFPQNPGW